MKLVQIILFPISLLYAGIIFLRNRFFDWGLLRSRQAVRPTMVVGNLSLGGTGKTPVTEYLLKLLSLHKVRIAFLSRGYGRKTRGYVRAGKGENALSIGDEPDQIASKFSEVPVAVCEDRLLGISKLAQENTDIQWIVLDDAYQHRKLKPDFSILLTDFSRPFYDDMLLPSGSLRDNRYEKRRADIILVTKCPPGLSREQRAAIISKMVLRGRQKVFFTTLEYGQPLPVFPDGPSWQAGAEIMGFSGIARPEGFKSHLSSAFFLKKFKSFPDHHIFTPSDLNGLRSVLDTFVSPERALLTTEKDARRIRTLDGWSNLPVFFLPIEIRFLDGEKEFNELIISEVKAQ